MGISQKQDELMSDLGSYDTVLELGFNGIGLPQVAYVTFVDDLDKKLLQNHLTSSCNMQSGGFCTLNAACENVTQVLPDYVF